MTATPVRQPNLSPPARDQNRYLLMRAESPERSLSPQPVLKRPCAHKVGNITGSTVVYIRAAGGKDYGRVNSSHHPSAARTNAIVYQESIEANSFISQRITLINADHSRRESFYIFGRSKSWPSQRV